MFQHCQRLGFLLPWPDSNRRLCLALLRKVPTAHPTEPHGKPFPFIHRPDPATQSANIRDVHQCHSAPRGSPAREKSSNNPCPAGSSRHPVRVFVTSRPRVRHITSACSSHHVPCSSHHVPCASRPVCGIFAATHITSRVRHTCRKSQNGLS